MMKASEVQRRYKGGGRDFSGASLRGQSFQGMNLAGADFSEADIRGANFTNANLRGAKFCKAKAGLQMRWAVFLVVVSWLVSALSGIFSVWISSFVALAFDTSSTENSIAGIVSLMVLAVFFIGTIHEGLVAGAGVGAFAGAAVAALVALTGAGALTGAVALGLAFAALALALTGAVAVAGALALAGALAVAASASAAVAGAIAGALALTGAIAGALVLVLVGAGALVLVGAGAIAASGAAATTAATTAELALALLGAYLGWRALKGNKKDAWIRTFAIAFAATGGTSFRNANLTDADFTAARLKSTDLRKANLTRTRWHNANKLDRARPGKSYLQDAKVRELVITGNGNNQKYDHPLNLRGINLRGANLVGADFTGSVLKKGTLEEANLTDAILTVANLNKANLRDTNLSRAKLKQAQLDGADLTGATLTGATIEDWGITITTKLNGVRCDYVFMRVPTNKDPNPRRKPDDPNKNFAEGEFVDFIAPMVGTLDLYHNKTIDPRLIAIAWQKLVEENPGAGLEMVSMEKRGKNFDKLLIRAKTNPNADHAQLNAKYFQTYEYLQTLSAEALLQLLLEKDNHIRQLSEWVGTAINSPRLYAQNYHHQGDNMSDKSSDISISHVTGSNINGVAAGESTAIGGKDLIGVAASDISGTVTNTINQPTESESPEAPTLADLLKQLQQAIASPDSGLSERDKKKALRHLDTIGKLGVERNNSDLRSTAEDAMDALPTILKRGTGLIEFLKSHFDVELDAILDNIQSLLGMES
ncbi:MAG: pentapeptide repeat-containing protein [Symploca sp. SIO2D2]|nr:pentapeptide repeat-containing protein [Symploca sp. SIO2D2]